MNDKALTVSGFASRMGHFVRRLILIAFALAAIGMGTVEAQAATHEHPVCGNSCSCSSTHSAYTWTAWDGTTSLANGNYYLTQDVVLTKTMVLNYSYTTRLCLNGYSITCDDMVFQIASSRVLMITDCVGTGYINGVNSGETIENYGSLTLWNGQILASSKYMAWSIVLDGGKFHMYGGKVESATDNAILVFPGSTVNVFGGTIHTKCYMKSAIYGYESGTSCNFKMTGGNITTDSGTYAVSIPNCNVTISGGNIGAGVRASGTGRSATVSGGTIAGTLEVEAPAVISGGNIGGLELTGNATVSDGTFGGTCTFSGSDNSITGGDFSGCDLIEIGGKTWISGGSFSKVQVANVPLYLNGVPEIGILQPAYASTISAQNPSGTGSFGGDPVAIQLDQTARTWADGDIVIQNVTSDAVAQKFAIGGADAGWKYLERSGNDLVLRILPGGQWGNNVTWKLQDGTLIISGTGAIAEEDTGRDYPWGPYTYNDEIKRIVVESGITRIPNYAFEFCQYATSITLPDTLQALSLSAFNNCSSLNNLILPASLTGFIDQRTAFIRCESLTDVYFMGTRAQWDTIADSDQVTSYQSTMTMHFLELHQGTATCTQAGTESYYQFDKTTVYGSMYNMDLEPITQLQTLPALGHRVIVEQQVESVYPQIVNNSTYPFTMSGNTYYSSNHTDSSSSEVKIIAQDACNLTLNYGVGSEKNYDKLYVLYNGVEQDVISGSVSGKSLTFEMAANDQLIVRYSKDYSQSTSPDQGWFSITMNLTTVEENVQADTLEPDCTNAVVCDYCQNVVKAALGHRVITEQTVQVDPITVTNTSSDPFKKEGNKYTSTNKTSSSSSEFVITARYACSLTLNYGSSSEASWDKLYILHNGTQKDVISGEISDMTMTLSLAVGDTVTVRYQKDGSVDKYSDCGWATLIYNPVEITDQVEIPVEELEAGCGDVITCSVCQIVVLDGGGHKYSNGFCENCGDFQACEGDGTEEDPYRIANAGNLYWFAANAGTNAVQGVLTDDITMPTVSGNIPAWTPVNFYGVLDGKDHSITGLNMESDGEYLGLFATNRGTIQNLELADASVVSTRTANGKIGGFAGTNYGTISNCVFRGTVYGGTGSNDAGGIAARNYGLISGCINYGGITGGYTTGGIVGIDNDKDGAATILNCANYGTVTGNGSSSSYAGGIVGFTAGVIQGCANFSNAITGKESNVSLGGIAGRINHINQHDIAAGMIDCYNLADLPLVNTAYNPNYEKCYVILANCFNYSSNGSPVVKSSTNVDYANCYYLSDSETDSLEGTTAMNAAQFASGEVAYLLQQGSTVRDIACPGDAWGQNVDQEAPFDAYPVLAGPEVYKNAVTDCTGATSGYQYSNTQETVSGGHTEETVAGKDATCTETGLTEGKKCTVCGETTVAQETIEALGHTAGEAVKENEVDGSYDSVVYCSVCKAELSREHMTTGPVQDGKMKFMKVALSLQDYVGLQTIVQVKNINGGVYDKAYLTYTQTSPDGEVVSETVDFDTKSVKGFAIGEVPVMAWSMSDEITVTAYYEVGGVVYQGESRTTSVRAQAMERINNSAVDAKTKAVCIAMLNYGTEVQKAFNHYGNNDVNLANYELAAEDKVIPAVNFTGEVIVPEGALKPMKNSLSLGAKVTMSFPIKVSDMSGYEVRYTIDGGDEIVVPASDIADLGAVCALTIPAKPLYMRSEYSIAIYDAVTGEKVYGDIECTIAAMAKTHEGTQNHNVVATMLAYGDAVAAM